MIVDDTIAADIRGEREREGWGDLSPGCNDPGALEPLMN